MAIFNSYVIFPAGKDCEKRWSMNFNGIMLVKQWYTTHILMVYTTYLWWFRGWFMISHIQIPIQWCSDWKLLSKLSTGAAPHRDAQKPHLGLHQVFDRESGFWLSNKGPLDHICGSRFFGYVGSIFHLLLVDNMIWMICKCFHGFLHFCCERSPLTAFAEAELCVHLSDIPQKCVKNHAASRGGRLKMGSTGLPPMANFYSVWWLYNIMTHDLK